MRNKLQNNKSKCKRWNEIKQGKIIKKNHNIKDDNHGKKQKRQYEQSRALLLAWIIIDLCFLCCLFNKFRLSD